MLHQIRRSFHSTCLLMTKKKPMPGIRHQIAALENAPDLKENPEDFEDLEADFTQVNLTHREYEAELEARRDRVRHIIVKNKYFPESRLPNFLFYAEKEEIRNLHARDPEEWTIERLAESFPATTEIIKKVLKAKWTPCSIKRIHTHDRTVIHNWELLKEGKTNEEIHLPNDLREHLNKFANRTFNHVPSINYKETLIPKLPKPKSNEFKSIITSCKKYAEKEHKGREGLNTKNTIENPFKIKISDPEKETFLLEEIQDHRRMRFEDWQKENMGQFKQLETTAKELSRNDDKNENSMMATTPSNPNGTGYIEKFENTEIVVSAEDTKRYEMSNFKERVHIPRKLWRKGFTYRIEDCYYDDDGEFLYRVPGMSGNQQMQSKKDSER